MTTKKTTEKEVEKTFTRRMKGERVIFHDLYELKEAKVKKNEGWNVDAPVIHEKPHKHFFRNVDSDGKIQIHCAPSLGHTHKVIVTQNKDGSHDINVGPAVVILKKKGQKVTYPYKYDNHTHEADYMYSEELTVRKYDNQALGMISAMQAREAALAKNPAE